MAESKSERQSVSGIGSYVDLWNYKEPTRYTAPCDGYVICVSGDGKLNRIFCYIFGTRVNIIRTPETHYESGQAIFVRKGSEISHDRDDDADSKSQFRFFPLQ